MNTRNRASLFNIYASKAYFDALINSAVLDTSWVFAFCFLINQEAFASFVTFCTNRVPNLWERSRCHLWQRTFNLLHLNLCAASGLWRMASRQPKACTSGSTSTTLTEESLSITGGITREKEADTCLMVIRCAGVERQCLRSQSKRHDWILCQLHNHFASSLCSSSKGEICSIEGSDDWCHKPCSRHFMCKPLCCWGSMYVLEHHETFNPNA